MARKAKVIEVGTKFGRLEVIGTAVTVDYFGQRRTGYPVRCGECGKELEIASCILPKKKSCGCRWNTAPLGTPDNNCGMLPAHILSQWHPTKNAYRPEELRLKSGERVWWVCDQNHEWQQTPHNRARKDCGCPYCPQGPHGRVTLASEDNNLAVRFPEIAAEWHPTKNGTVNPSDILPGNETKFWWKCEFGHEWQAVPWSRTTNGTGCPICKESRGEKAIKRVLDTLGVTYKHQMRLGVVRNDAKSYMRFDFAVSTGARQGLIEYHGLQHYQPVAHFGGKMVFVDTQRRDALKRETCRRLGFPLLEIPHWDYHRIEELVKEFMASLDTAWTSC